MISYIIPTRNRPDMLLRTLKAIDSLGAHDAEVIVVGNGAPEFREAIARRVPGQVVVDLVRVSAERSKAGEYDGICW